VKNKRFDIDSYKGVVFDLDGTLVDSLWLWDKVDTEFFKKRGMECPADYKKDIMAMGIEKVADYTIERFNLREKPDDIIREWYECAAYLYAAEVELMPGVLEYIEFLREHDVKIALATANDRKLSEECLKNNEILECFHNITTLREVNGIKGEPDIYNLAAEKMGLNNKECIVFEDILQGIEGAKKGGYRVVAFKNKYNKDNEEIFEKADKVVSDYRELCIKN